MTAQTTTRPSDRDMLLAVIGTNRNGWTAGFAYASHHIAKAVVGGLLSEDDLTGFAAYDETQAQALAARAGLPWHGQPGQPGGPERAVDTEDVSIAVDAILGLAGQPLSVEGQPWHLYDHDGDGRVEGQRTTCAALSAVTATLSVTAAAQALVDSDAYFSAHLATYGGVPRCSCHDADGQPL